MGVAAGVWVQISFRNGAKEVTTKLPLVGLRRPGMIRID